MRERDTELLNTATGGLVAASHSSYPSLERKEEGENLGYGDSI